MKKDKFKIGDLVTLSAAGRKAGQNWRYRKGFGIVIFVGNRKIDAYPIDCYWTTTDGWTTKQANFKQYELKFFKPDKK